MNELSKFIIGDTIANIKDALSRQFIGNLENLRTESKDSIVSAINEVDSNLSGKIGNLENLPTESKDSLVSAITEVNSNLTERTKTYSSTETQIPLNQDFIAPKNGIVLVGGYDNVGIKLIVNNLIVVMTNCPTVTFGENYESTRFFYRVCKNDAIYIDVSDTTKGNVHFFNPTE